MTVIVPGLLISRRRLGCFAGSPPSQIPLSPLLSWVMSLPSVLSEEAYPQGQWTPGAPANPGFLIPPSWSRPNSAASSVHLFLFVLRCPFVCSQEAQTPATEADLMAPRVTQPRLYRSDCCPNCTLGASPLSSTVDIRPAGDDSGLFSLR